MKCNFMLIFLLLNFYFLCSIYCTEVEESNSNRSMTDTEFETDLLKLLTRIHSKKIQDENAKNGKELISVKIKNFYDLTDFLSSINKIKDKIIQEKNNYYKTILELSDKLNKYIQMNQNNLSNLKDKYDKIIEKSNNINKDLNEKKTLQIKLKTNYENIRPEYESSNEKFVNNVVNNIKNFNKDNSQNFLYFNKKIVDLNREIENRNELKEQILKLKEDYEKFDIEANLVKKTRRNSKLDKKLFEVIQNNMQNNINQLKQSFTNTTLILGALKRESEDKTNLSKFEIEKNQQNELYKSTNKQIRDLLVDHEKIQYEITDLMKKKNKLKEYRNSKELENNLKINKVKSEISGLESDIKNIETKMLKNVKDHKAYLLKNELKLKNLMLILNNFLLKINNGKNQNDMNGLLNNLLFETKTLDLKNGVNSELIEEISKSILN